MYPTYEDKGKIFTPVIQKKPIPVIIQTVTHRIEGNVHVRQEQRLKDELDSAEPFIAVTDATLFDLQGNPIRQADFVAVQRHLVIWITPNENQEE